MKSIYRGILVFVVNIFISGAYLVLGMLLLNHPVIINILKSIAVFTKSKTLAVVIVVTTLGFPLPFILKFIKKKTIK